MSLRKFAIVTAATAALFSSHLLACPKCEAISDSAPAVLFEDVTALSHPITTTSAEAQKYFDQGLTLVYAFNHDEAIRSFKEAAKLDPNCAMAWWGVALALGPNYNFDVTPEGEVAAYEAIQKAMKLRDKVSPAERDYIDALAVRYTDAKEPDLKKLANTYAAAMKSLHMKYPDDMDAATLYADSMMVLRPWRLWTSDGKPEEGTLELVAVLEDVLSKNPNHIGANHLYIHAVEAVYPERALAAADRLPGLSPASGHIVHMPSHIYHRLGDYNSSAMTNEAAIIADDAYFASRPRTGAYAMMYYNHNVHFAAFSHGWQGNMAATKKWSKKLHTEVLPIIPEMPPLEQFATIEGLMAVQFCDWDAILAMPKPADTLRITQALWHFGRGMAFASKGEMQNAMKEQESLKTMSAAIPPETLYGMFNTTGDAFGIANHVLAARIAEKSGNVDEAMKQFNLAVEIQDRLIYDEPAPWPISVRQNLGGMLLRAGRYADAEKVFRADLKKHPRHGRGLFGLMESLRGQGREHDAKLVEMQFQEAWKHADVKLSVEVL